MQRPLVVPCSPPPAVTSRRTLMGLIGSGMCLSDVTCPQPPAEHPLSRITRTAVLLSLVRAPARPPRHAYFGSQSTPRTTAVYASDPALPRRPQDSLPSRLLSFGRTRLALASSYRLLLSHPAYGSHLGCLTANRSDGHGCRILGLGSQSSAIFLAPCHVVLSL